MLLNRNKRRIENSFEEYKKYEAPSKIIDQKQQLVSRTTRYSSEEIDRVSKNEREITLNSHAYTRGNAYKDPTDISPYLLGIGMGGAAKSGGYNVENYKNAIKDIKNLVPTIESLLELAQPSIMASDTLEDSLTLAWREAMLALENESHCWKRMSSESASSFWWVCLNHWRSTSDHWISSQNACTQYRAAPSNANLTFMRNNADLALGSSKNTFRATRLENLVRVNEITIVRWLHSRDKRAIAK